MRYKSFRIQNFKGIKDTTINLEGIAGASVFTIVGLNESGKTTILEAKRFFQERLASDKIDRLGSGFEKNAKALIDALRRRLEAS